MMAPRRTAIPAVALTVALAMLVTPAVIAGPGEPGQKGKKPGGGKPEPGIAMQVDFWDRAGDALTSDGNGTYVDTEGGIQAGKTPGGGFEFKTYADPDRWLEVYFGDQRPEILGSGGDPVAFDAATIMFGFGSSNDFDMCGLALNVPVAEPMRTRFEVGRKKTVFVEYGTREDVCTEHPADPPHAVVKRVAQGMWEVSGTTAAIVQVNRNSWTCLGYFEMPMKMTISAREDQDLSGCQ